MTLRRPCRTAAMVLAALTVACATMSARAETYYLDAAAPGPTYDGSEARPWRTIAQMQTFLNGLADHGSGDTVLVAPGTYDRYVDGALTGYGFTPLEEQQLPRTDWLVIKAQDPDNKPVFPYIQIYGARNVYLELNGLHVRSLPPHGWYCVHVRNGCRHIRLLNLEVDAVDDHTQLPTGINVGYNNPTDILIEGCEIYGVDTAMTPDGVDITIRGNHCHDIADSSIKSGTATNMVVENNYIHDQVPRIVRLNTYGTVSGTFAKNDTITQDTTGAQATVYVVRADSLEVTPVNKVDIEFLPGYVVRRDAGGATIGPLTSITVADRTHGSGLSVRTNGYTARGNIIHDYGNSGGIFVYPIGTPYSNMLFENNLIYNAISRNVVFNDIGDNFVVRNNTFVGGVDAYFYTGYDGSGLHLYNNLMVGLTVMTADPLANIQHARNIVQYITVRTPWSTGGAFPPGGSSVLLGYGATGAAAFNALFVDAPSYDFRLRSGSAAIDFGDPALAPDADLRGLPRDSLPDAGCYEYYVPPADLAWDTVVPHGPAGDVASALVDGAVEPRPGAATVFRATCPIPFDAATLAPGSVTLTGASSGDLSALIQSTTLDLTGRTLTIALSQSLPPGETCTLAIASTVRAIAGEPLADDTDLVLTFLPGDVDASGTVTAADAVAVRSAIGQPLDSANAFLDLDRSGAITAADMREARRLAALP